MRQAWMAVLSNADIGEIETRWKFIGFEGPYEFLEKTGTWHGHGKGQG